MPSSSKSNAFISSSIFIDDDDIVNMDDNGTIRKNDLDTNHLSTDTQLSWFVIFAYSCGHVMNDLSAACWFTYLLVMLHDRHIESWHAAIILLSGQVADAIATPIAGILSDKSTGLCICGITFGRRHTWYIFGTFTVAVNFTFLFGLSLPVLIDANAPTWSLMLYYCLAASIFNIGWASVQVTHMAMIPELTDHEHTRVVLNSARYSECVFANVLVFAVLFIFVTSGLNPEERWSYLCYFTLGLGFICTGIFLVGTFKQDREASYGPNARSPSSGVRATVRISDSEEDSYIQAEDAPNGHRSNSHWKEWLYDVDFYKVAWVYMCSRLLVNVSQVFLAFYVQDALLLGEEYITIVPCVVYLSSFLSCVIMKRCNAMFGRRLVTVVGTLFCCAALIVFYFLTPSMSQWVHAPSVFLGLGIGAVMVCSTQLTADLLGDRTHNGAFVYGALSFTDKMANGAALFVLQAFNQDSTTDGDVDASNPANGPYIRIAECAVPFAASVGALLMVMCGIDIQKLIEAGRSPSAINNDDLDGTASTVPYSRLTDELDTSKGIQRPDWLTETEISDSSVSRRTRQLSL